MYEDDNEDEDDKVVLGKKYIVYVIVDDFDEEDLEFDVFNEFEFVEKLI